MNAALLITKNIIESRYYHHEGHSRDERLDIKVTWDESDLRKYLNNEFYAKFDDADKSRIVLTTNKNQDNQFFGITGGKDTKDYVFILSLDEYVRYFCDEISKQQLANKDYDGLCEIKYYPSRRKAKYGDKFSGMWLRSPGYYDFHAVYVNANGCIKAGGDRFNRIYGIRPAIWLRMEDK